jgi:hypothetical protein
VWIEHFIRVQNEHPITGGLLEDEIPGGSKVPLPGNLDHFRIKTGGYLRRIVSGSSIADDDAVNRLAHAGKTSFQ